MDMDDDALDDVLIDAFDDMPPEMTPVQMPKRAESDQRDVRSSASDGNDGIQGTWTKNSTRLYPSILHSPSMTSSHQPVHLYTADAHRGSARELYPVFPPDRSGVGADAGFQASPTARRPSADRMTPLQQPRPEQAAANARPLELQIVPPQHHSHATKLDMGTAPVHDEPGYSNDQLQELNRESLMPTDGGMADADLKQKQGELQLELEAYQLRMDYLARAMAGDTRHQVQARRRREQERHDREKHRLAAREVRIEQQLDREHEREARRAHIHDRIRHRASCSPSPERATHNMDGVSVDESGQ